MTLKSITRDGIPAALERAHLYRLLNQSDAAESICLDVLSVEENNHDAVVELILALTDQFREGSGDLVSRARALIPRLTSEYDRAYYSGIVCERRAKAVLDRGSMGAAEVATQGFREAMTWYEDAERKRPPGNDDSILRWNTCARLLSRHEHDGAHAQDYAPALED